MAVMAVPPSQMTSVTPPQVAEVPMCRKILGEAHGWLRRLSTVAGNAVLYPPIPLHPVDAEVFGFSLLFALSFLLSVGVVFCREGSPT